MDPNIRLANIEDAPALALLAERTFRDTYGPGHVAANVDAYIADHIGEHYSRRELASPAFVTLLADSSGQLIGYTQLRKGEPPACVIGRPAIEILRFYVARAWHGRGVAYSLMSAALAAGAPENRVAWLLVLQRNARAVAFYRRCGFGVVGTQPYQMGSELQDDYVMTKALG